MAHTPAPWNVTWGTALGGEGHHIMDNSGVDSGLSIIATVNFHDDSEGETKANAALIAAAPELLAALQALNESGEWNGTSWTVPANAWRNALAAIAKAGGAA